MFSDRDPCMKPILEGGLVFLKQNRARGNGQEHLKDGGENHGDDYYPDIEGEAISIHCLRINASEYFRSVLCECLPGCSNVPLLCSKIEL